MAPPLMNLSIYYLVTKTMGCYALGGYKNIVTKREREVTKSNGPEFLLHLNEDSDAASRPHVAGHSKRNKCLNRTAAFVTIT